METIKLKPSFSRILLSGLIMGSVLFPFTLILTKGDLTDITPVSFVLIYIYLASLLFCVIFFNLPYFAVEISDMYLFGPSLSTIGWRQTHMHLVDIDTKNIKSFQWLGFYIIRSTDGAIITVCCFDENQFRKLITIITRKLTV